MKWGSTIVLALAVAATFTTARADCVGDLPYAQLLVYWNSDPENFGDVIRYAVYHDNGSYGVAVEDVSDHWDNRISSLKSSDDYPADWWIYDGLDCDTELASGTGSTDYVGDDNDNTAASLRFECSPDNDWTSFKYYEDSRHRGCKHPLTLYRSGGGDEIVMEMWELPGDWNDEISAIELNRTGTLPRDHCYWYFYKDKNFNSGEAPDLVLKDNEDRWDLGDLNDKITSYRLVISNSDTPPNIHCSYVLDLESIGSGSGTVIPSPELPIYPPGTVVTLTPVADGNDRFWRWGGDAAGLGNPLVITMDCCRSITAEFLAPAGVESESHAMGLDLLPVRPTPSKGVTRIDFTMQVEGRIRLSILDLRGREVCRLSDRTYAAGPHHVLWDGRLDGDAAPAGMYVVRLARTGQEVTRKLLILR